jgi:hypothetical protein
MVRGSEGHGANVSDGQGSGKGISPDHLCFSKLSFNLSLKRQLLFFVNWKYKYISLCHLLSEIEAKKKSFILNSFLRITPRKKFLGYFLKSVFNQDSLRSIYFRSMNFQSL